MPWSQRPCRITPANLSLTSPHSSTLPLTPPQPLYLPLPHPPTHPPTYPQLARNEGLGGVNERRFDLANAPPKKGKVGSKQQSTFIKSAITTCDKQLNKPADTNPEGLPKDSPLALGAMDD